MNYYLHPEASDSSSYTEGDYPLIQQMEDAFTKASATGSPVIAMGDWNGRTGTLVPNDDHPPRRSRDMTVNGRGKDLLRMAAACDLTILNGAMGTDAASGSYTSFQPQGMSVIDYSLVSDCSTHRVLDFVVRARPETPWSDHAVSTLLWASVALPPKSCARETQNAPSSTSMPARANFPKGSPR